MMKNHTLELEISEISDKKFGNTQPRRRALLANGIVIFGWGFVVLEVRLVVLLSQGRNV